MVQHGQSDASAFHSSSLHLLTLGVGEMDDRVILDDVDLLNPRNGVDTQPFQCTLQALIIRGRSFMLSLLLPTIL